MRQIYYFTSLLLLGLTACAEGAEETTESKEEVASKELAFEIIDYQKYETLFQKNDDVLYVVNFWATWCKPCVEELPHFMEVKNQHSDDAGFKMVLVSLDKASDFETKVKAFMEDRKMEVDLYLLDDVKNMNTWIPAINSGWSGSIPVTILYKNGKQLAFHEGQLSKDELTTLISKHN